MGLIEILAPLGVIAGVLGALWFVKRSGKHEQRADTAEKVLRDLVDAARPPTDTDLERVRDKYRRD